MHGAYMHLEPLAQVGKTLGTQREKAFLLQEQQRAMIGIQSKEYNSLWLRLQAIPFLGKINL